MNILVLNGSPRANGNTAAMIVLASPIYYHSFTGQLQCAINRNYALDKPKNLKKAALILSSGSDHVYCGAISEYQNSFLNYLKLEDMGIILTYSFGRYCPIGYWELSSVHWFLFLPKTTSTDCSVPLGIKDLGL